LRNLSLARECDWWFTKKKQTCWSG
jgi:hypothetical protein